MKVVWLASYPRSGNTWLRFLLYNYIYGEPRESGEILKVIPAIHRHKLNEEYEGAILCKTHFVWSNSHPHFDHTVGFIYIMRHPKDVLLSNLNYLRLSNRKNVNAEEFAMRFIQSMGVPRWRNMGMGSWVEHIASWLSNQSLPHVVMLYETMLDMPHDCLKQIVRFLDLEINEGRIARAVELSSFENIRKMEEKEKREKIDNTLFPGSREEAEAGVRFVHKGGKGQSLSHISQKVDELFDERFKEVLKLVGYQ